MVILNIFTISSKYIHDLLLLRPYNFAVDTGKNQVSDGSAGILVTSIPTVS